MSEDVFVYVAQRKQYDGKYGNYTTKSGNAMHKTFNQAERKITGWTLILLKSFTKACCKYRVRGY